MDQARRVNQVWNWLPAFRAVAETQHLPSASSQAHLSPSALSRAVKQLEDDLGVPLFNRINRQLELTPAGHALLDAVREAMERLEAGVAQATDTRFAGTVNISAPAPLTAIFVLPALRRLGARHPELVPNLIELEGEQVERQLLDGRLDLAIADRPRSTAGLSVVCLGVITRGVYCGEGHPLFDHPDVSVEQLSRHDFLAPSDGSDDFWPKHHERRVRMRTQRVDLALRACAQGDLLAVLPDIVATAYPGPGELRRIPLDICASTPIYAVRRKQLGGAASDCVGAVLEQVHSEFTRAARRSNPYLNPASALAS